MAVNPDVYGTISNWEQYANGGGATADLRTYTLTSYIASRTETPIGQPIDKSLSCSGLGTESALSHRKFFDTDSLLSLGLDGGGIATPTIIEDRTVTNWCFGDTQNNYDGSSAGQRCSVIVDGDGTQRGTNAQEMRYAPEPVSGWWNPSNIKPIVQFSHKNLVARILVRVSDTKAWNASLHDCTLDEYIASYTTTYPYIYGVFFDLWTNVGGGTTTRQRLGRINNCAIAILDSIPLPKTSPYMYNLVSYGGYEIKLLGGFPNQSGKINTYGGTDSTNNKTYIGCCCPDTWETYITWATTTRNEIHGYTCRTYDETFHDEVFEQIACLGILFTGSTNTAQSGTLIDDNMYCGVLDENLIGHGEWTSGIKNAINDQLSWTNSNDSTYDPSYIPDPSGDEPYDANVELLHTGNLVQAGNWYVDTIMGEYVTLVNWCSSINLDTVSKNEYFFGQNPIDCIVTARLLFTDYDLGVTAASEKSAIIVGSYPVDPQDNTRAKAYEVSQYSPETVNIGSSNIGGYYHDFRDLSPYSSLTLLLPFAGAVDLPTDVFINHSCTLFETVDPISGDLKYNIYCDSALYTTVTGNCGVDLSIVGLETATYRLEKYRLQSQAISQGFNAAASLTGGVSGALIAANYGNIEGALSQLFGGAVNATNSLVQSFRTEKQMSRTLPAPAILQKASGDVECGCGFEPVILHTYPRMLSGFETSLESYRQRVGFATYTVGKIKDQKYAVVCDNVVLSGFSCTKEEMIMIKQLLESGIYIK